MNRRGFLANTARLGTGSLLASCAPLHALAQVEAERRLLWYASHCAGCGRPSQEPKSVAQCIKDGGHYWCWDCVWIGLPWGRAQYLENPPADFGPGPEWRQS